MDIIRQNRLSLRLDKYMDDFKQKNLSRDNPARVEWDASWKAAELARTNETLTPEIVDDVRIAMNKL